MMNRILLFLLLIGFISCSNLDSASPTKRNTFVHYYGGVGNYTASDAIQVKDGFVILGDSVGTTGNAIVVIKTNTNGNLIWRKWINGASSSNIKRSSDGYLIIGDSMKFDFDQSSVKDQIIHKMRIIKLDSLTGEILNGSNGKPLDFSWGTLELDDAHRTDIRGGSLTFDNNGDIISTSVISRPKLPSLYQSTQISLHNPATLQMKWTQVYNQDQRDYQNSKSVHFDGVNIIYAASAVLNSTNTANSFVRILAYKDNSGYTTFVNAALFGENETNEYYSGSDVQPNAVGYGIIGTTKTYKGENSNIYFVQTLKDGTAISGTDIYIDGPSLLKDKKAVDKSVSIAQDEGNVIAPSTDGGFLLVGSTTSTADGSWGNGGKDVLLVKISPFSEILWYKVFGGTGDEVPSSVKQTSEGGYLISGTLTLAGQNSIFIVKTDSNGEIKN
jgi:hypothetical protein